MHFICAVDDIDEGQSKRFDIGERSLFVVKKDAEVYAYYNRCPHLGIELEWQEDRFLDPDGALIQCSTHGALFLIEDGHCISGPCSGDQLEAVNTLLDAGSLYLMDCSATEHPIDSNSTDNNTSVSKATDNIAAVIKPAAESENCGGNSQGAGKKHADGE